MNKLTLQVNNEGQVVNIYKQSEPLTQNCLYSHVWDPIVEAFLSPHILLHILWLNIIENMLSVSFSDRKHKARSGVTRPISYKHTFLTNIVFSFHMTFQNNNRIFI